jgi:potassium-dependent mechanosensitive channel
MSRFGDALCMPHRVHWRTRLWVASWIIALLAFVSNGSAEEVTVSPDTVSAIPVASIAVEASTLESFLRMVESDLVASPVLEEIAEELPEVDAALIELSARTDERLERGYDRADLENLDAAWRRFGRDLAGWQMALRARLTNLDEHSSDRSEREAVWKATATAAVEDRAPAEVRAQVAQARDSLQSVARPLRKERDQALGLQKRVVTLQGRVAGARDSLVHAREEVLAHVLNRNQSVIWNVELNPDLDRARDDLVSAFGETRRTIGEYADRVSTLIAFHLILILVVVWASWLARIWMSRPPLYGTRPVPDALTHPIAAGLVLGLSASMWIYAEAPPKLGWILGLLALPFLYFVLRSLFPGSLRRPVAGLVALVLLDFARRVLLDFEFAARVMLVLEAGIALAGLIWLRRPKRLAEVPRPDRLLWFRILGMWLHLVLIGAGISLGGAILGWTSLADLLMSAMVIGTFAGAILFTAARVIEAIAEAAIYSGKLDGIRILRNHRRAFLVTLSRTVRFLGFATWAVLVLRNLALEDGVREAAETILGFPIGYGSVHLTLGGLGAFGITLWVSWILARFIAVALDEEVLSRVSLARGVPFALTTITRYTILVLGFIAAVAVLGFEVSNLALLVSALGVGIGFGMQNMVNNFISGLILLFERPIKVGDLVSLEQLLGRVSRIGIRSSTIRSFDGADVIVPNGDLISNRVTNWTLADTRRRLSFPVGVAYGTPARRVIELLEEVADANPAILSEPAPNGLFTGFGDSSLDFELRAWSESEDALTIVRSEVAVGIQEALAAAGIEVPFPQRDVHIKGVTDPPGAGGAAS